MGVETYTCMRDQKTDEHNGDAGSLKCSPQVAVQVAAATTACSAVERLITVQLRLLPLARRCSPFGEKTRRTLGKISSSEYPCVPWSRKPNVRLLGQRHATSTHVLYDVTLRTTRLEDCSRDT
jgi:hypothetical protein